MVSIVTEALIRMMAATQRERGQALVEYALILGLVVVGAIALLTTLGGDIATKLGQVTNAL